MKILFLFLINKTTLALARYWETAINDFDIELQKSYKKQKDPSSIESFIDDK